LPDSPSRNSPCPCGSGRRYKDCHGALAVSSGDGLPSLLASALTAQQSGRLDVAIAGYAQALELAPGHFDALHMQGVAHFQRGEFDAAAAFIDRALARDPASAPARFNRELVRAALERRSVATEIEREAKHFRAQLDQGAGEAVATAADHVRTIAFYLPQFHRIPENDAWWGEGFTEWTNVRKAARVFADHWQPHAPAELGYYDLTDSATRAAQAALARTHGVDAFCYYHYWFGGKRLLEQPLDAVLSSGAPDFPFCVCWANENWTRRWDGRDDDILMSQPYGPDDARALASSLLPFFRDPRYVRVNGRPLLAVYKAADIPDVRDAVAIWRRVCVEGGVGDPYLCAVQRRADDDPTALGFDAAIEFPPIGHMAENVTSRFVGEHADFRGMIFDYRNLAAYYLMLPRPGFPQFRCVTPMWDNTARRPNDGMILADSSPEAFGVWMRDVLRQTRWRHSGDERLVFINAWNEWAEGNHLEPDLRHGRGYLQALSLARRAGSDPLPERPALHEVETKLAAQVRSDSIAVDRPGSSHEQEPAGVSVVMPVYNHARFLERTLESLLAQSEPPAELVAVDDGSTDDSVAIVAAFARRAPFPVTLVRQPNAGADCALNRGIALARGDVIALLNSDDGFAPDRLRRMTASLDGSSELAFSGVLLVDDEDRPSAGEYAQALRERIDAAGAAKNLLEPLVLHNIATSTGNLVFRRSLVQRVGGFAALTVCHDWDFVLAATYHTRIAFVPDPLYVYRLHDANTYAGHRLRGRLEGDYVLQRFFAGIETHPWLDALARADFRVFARAHGLQGYWPRAQDAEHP